MSITANGKTIGNNGSAGNLTIASPSTKVGDVIIAAVTAAGNGFYVNVPDSTWTMLNNSNSPTVGDGTSHPYIFSHRVGASEPSSYVFPTNSSDYVSGILLAFSDVDLGTITDTNGSVMTAIANGTTSLTSALVPSNYSCLPVAFFTIYAGGGTIAAPTGLASGWVDQGVDQRNGYHVTEAQIGSITVDTVTPIRAQATWASGVNSDGMATILLLKPATHGAVTIAANGTNVPIVNGQIAQPIAINGSGTANATTLVVSQSGWYGAITPTSADPTRLTFTPTSANGPTASFSAVGAGSSPGVGFSIQAG